MLRHLFLLLALTSLAAFADPPSLEEIAKGGYVIFFRHPPRDMGASLPASQEKLDNKGLCIPGLELNAEGHAVSQKIRDTFKKFNIKIGQAYASPTCRTRQMGEIVTEAPVEIRRELGWRGMYYTLDEMKLLLKLLYHLLT